MSANIEHVDRSDLAERHREGSLDAPSEQCRALFLIPSLVGGGAERVIVTLLKHLDRRRFRLTLAVLRLRDGDLSRELPSDVEIIDLGASRVRYGLWRIISLIWNLRSEVVFSTHGELNLALALCLPLMPHGVRFIARETQVVGLGMLEHRFPVVWRALYRLLYKKYDLVVCQSRHMQRELIECCDLPSEKSVVINNPVDASHIHRLAAQPVLYPPQRAGVIKLVAAGRLVDVKGFDLLIEAIALVGVRDLHLVILGEGPLRGELEALAKARGVAEQIHLAGFQTNPYAWFANADAFVLSSRHEGFPNVVLEALACGTPVIATPAPGGLQEILGDVPECIVAPSVSAVALADAIRTWLAGERKRIPQAATERYALERIVAQYEEAIRP